MTKIPKKLVSAVAGVGVSAAFAVPIGLGISQATKEHKYNDFNGPITQHTDDLALRKSSGDKIPEILGAYFDFGNEQVSIPEIKEWQAAIKADPSPANTKLKDEITEKINDRFEKIRSTKGVNPTVVINTKIMTIKNDYFDVFGWDDTTDFFEWFINDVSWGPDLLTLREFDIVRGVSKDGTMITLGGHSGTRESTNIKFYPDSFFGVQNIYDGTGDAVLVDTANLELGVNKDVVRTYAKPLIEKLDANKDKLFDPNFENNEELEKDLLNVNTIENFIEVYDDQTLSKLSESPLIEGSTSDKQTLAVDGGFPSLADFLTYVHGKGTVVTKDTIKDSQGSNKTVYPKRYLRRLLVAMYGYTSKDNFRTQDAIRKRIESNNPKYSKYFGKQGSVDSEINKISDNAMPTTLVAPDGKNIQEKADRWSSLADVVVKPYSDSVEFNVSNKLIITQSDGDILKAPLVISNFNNFNAELPKVQAENIGNIIRQITKMDIVRVVTSADKGFDGLNKVSLLFEKFQNLIGTIEDYKTEHNWAPVDFINGQPDLNEFIPNLYLYKYQKRQHGFLDYATTNSRIFSTDEMETAKYVSGEIEKYGIDFSKETLDINNPLTTKKPGDAAKTIGSSSYDDDLAKVLADIPSGVDEPLVKKYFEYEARSKTKINKIGIEWLKYVASHEYGHHQTLTYAKDISATSEKTKEQYKGAQGIYDTSGSQITSGATINEHAYGDTYSRNYVNSYLRARGGMISDLNPADVDKKVRTLEDDVATMQINPDASKEDPYYVFLLNSANKNRFTSDESSTTAPVEKGIYSYANFLNSWRAFKNPDQFLEALRLKKGELEGLRAKLDGETNVGYVAYLLNALDQSSYSLDPTIMAPIAPFAEGTNRAIDPSTTNSEEGSKVNPLNIINGWTGYYGVDSSISPEIMSLMLQDSLGYKTLVYKNGANSDDSIMDRMQKNTDGSYQEYNIPVPTAIASEMLNGVADIDISAATSVDMFSDNNILPPSGGGIPYAVVPSISDSVTSINNEFSADIRKATDAFITLDVDYSSGTPVYYLPGDKNEPTTAVKGGKISISSMTFKSVPLVGIIKENINSLVTTAFNEENGDLAWNTATKEVRFDYFKNFILKQINKDSDRKIAANLPVEQLANGKKTYTEWFNKTFGMEGIPNSQNVSFKKSYGEYLFQTYYKNFGRFLEFQKDYKDSDQKKIVPTTYLITAMGTAKASTNKLNDVYASYLSQGSYSFFGQLMADYQINLPETINRDLNQLIYSPSTKKLQDGSSTEAWTGINYALPPVFTSIFGESGKVSFATGMGDYDESSKLLKLVSRDSGFFEDLALRREMDSSLYMLDEKYIEIYYRKMISDKTEYFDHDGNKITNPDDWRKVFEEYGHPLTRTGKALVNFYKDTSGAVTDRDISGFFVDKYTGMGRLFGYLSKDDLDKFHYIAFVGSDGTTKYVSITKNFSNQFFHKTMAVEGRGAVGQKVSIGEGYYDEKGNWVDYAKGKEQIGWASDKFLADSYANALLQSGGSYKMYLTHDKTLSDKRPVELGSLDTLTVNHKTMTYGLTHDPREVMYNNGFDVYSGKFEITKNEDGETIMRVRRQNDQ